MHVDAEQWGDSGVAADLFAPEPLAGSTHVEETRQLLGGHVSQYIGDSGTNTSREPSDEREVQRAAHQALERALASSGHGGQRERNQMSALFRALDGLKRLPLERLLVALYQARQQGRHVYLLGLGDSVSTASYFARDLARYGVLATQPGRASCASQADLDSTASIGSVARTTRLGLFPRRLPQLRTRDVVIVISTESHAEDICPLLLAARRQGATTFALVGGANADLGDISALAGDVIAIGCSSPEYVKSGHLFVEHLLCAALEDMPHSPLRDMTSTGETTGVMAGVSRSIELA